MRRATFVRTRSTRNQRGVTIIELIMFILIVSVALVGVLSVLNYTAAHSANPLVRKQAIAVAEAMMEEVLSKDFPQAVDDCTPVTAPSCRLNTPLDRQNYNDVNDYDTWNKVGVTDVTGAGVPGLGSYSVTIAVAGANPGGVAMRQVTINVTGNGETITLTGFRANYP